MKVNYILLFVLILTTTRAEALPSEFMVVEPFSLKGDIYAVPLAGDPYTGTIKFDFPELQVPRDSGIKLIDIPVNLSQPLKYSIPLGTFETQPIIPFIPESKIKINLGELKILDAKVFIQNVEIGLFPKDTLPDRFSLPDYNFGIRDSSPPGFTIIRVNFTLTPVPEPSTMLLFGSGLAGLVGFGRKRLFKKA